MSTRIINPHYLLIGKLLNYPTPSLQEHLPEIQNRLLEDPRLNLTLKQKAVGFIHYVSTLKLLDWQARYVNTFDMKANHSLHLTHHLYGEERERGLAMADLTEHYQKAGWRIDNGELPDYLPLILEFLSTQPSEAATTFLNQAANAMHIVTDNLINIGSEYAVLLQILLSETNRIPVKQKTATAS